MDLPPAVQFSRQHSLYSPVSSDSKISKMHHGHLIRMFFHRNVVGPLIFLVSRFLSVTESTV